MKTSRRSAISQSMDLFIIIAAVLGIGGVVTAAVYGLAGSAVSNSSIQVVQASAQGGAVSASTSINAFSITIKNTGSSPITGTLTITLGGTKEANGSTVPTPTCSNGTGGTVSVQSGSVVQITCSGVTLTPGEQVAIFEGTVGAGTPLTTGWNVGSTYAVTVLFGSAQTAINLVA